MHRPARLSSLCIFLTVGTALMACGKDGAESAEVATVRNEGATACPSAAEMEIVLQFPVSASSAPANGCRYDASGATITIEYQPADRAEEVYARIRQESQSARGTPPDRLIFDDGGFTYGTSDKKVGAAVSKGRLYYVEIDHASFTGPTMPTDAAVRVLKLATEKAPGPSGT